MIEEKYGDLLTCGADMICHQVNTYGVMGAGVAWSIRDKLLTDVQYQQYVRYCDNVGDKALGVVQFIRLNGEKPSVLANCFSQRGWAVSNSLTDYDAFRKCMEAVERKALMEELTVALPGYMGCGIAGGDWTEVHGIIAEVFGRSKVPLTVVYHDRHLLPVEGGGYD